MKRHDPQEYGLIWRPQGGADGPLVQGWPHPIFDLLSLSIARSLPPAKTPCHRKAHRRCQLRGWRARSARAGYTACCGPLGQRNATPLRPLDVDQWTPDHAASAALATAFACSRAVAAEQTPLDARRPLRGQPAVFQRFLHGLLMASQQDSLTVLYPENVRSPGWTGSRRGPAKPTRLMRNGLRCLCSAQQRPYFCAREHHRDDAGAEQKRTAVSGCWRAFTSNWREITPPLHLDVSVGLTCKQAYARAADQNGRI
jgi:hypothetical protein